MRSRGKVNMAEATVEFSQPAQITITPHSSDISRIWGMGGKEMSFSGKVSTGGKFAGLWERSVRVTQLNRITHTDHLCGGGGGVGDLKRRGVSLYKSSMQCSSDYCPCGCAKKTKQRENEEKGKRWSIFICELCTDILHCFEDTRLLPSFFSFFLRRPTFGVQQTFEHPLRMSNLSPRSVRESDVPPPHLLPHPCTQTPHLHLSHCNE